MSSADRDAAFDARLRVLQIVHAALCLGAFTFLVVVLVIRSGGQGQPAPQPPILSLVCLALAVAQFVAALFVPEVATASQRQRTAALPDGGDRLSWAAVYQTRLILRLALLEGGALILTIAYLQEGSRAALSGAGAFVGVMLLQFPRRHALENWCDEQRERARLERSGD